MKKGHRPEDKQHMTFATVLAATGNGRAAARAAGISDGGGAPARMAENPRVSEFIGLINGTISSHILKAEERQLWLSNVILGNTTDQKVLSNGKIVEYRVSTADRIKAATLLAKMRGELIDRAQISGPNGDPLIVKVVRFGEGTVIDQIEDQSGNSTPG